MNRRGFFELLCISPVALMVKPRIKDEAMSPRTGSGCVTWWKLEENAGIIGNVRFYPYSEKTIDAIILGSAHYEPGRFGKGLRVEASNEM